MVSYLIVFLAGYWLRRVSDLVASIRFNRGMHKDNVRR